MGLTPSAPIELVAQLLSGRASATNLSPQTNPTLARLRAEYEVAERTLQREVRKQYPDLTIGPQLESEEGQSRIGLGSGIPLPILNSNRGGIAQAHGQRQIARAAYETEYERLTGRLASLHAHGKGLAVRRKSLNKSLIPLIDQQVTQARKLLELGEGNSLVLLESLIRAHDTKLRLIELQLELAKNNNNLTHLIGLRP